MVEQLEAHCLRERLPPRLHAGVAGRDAGHGQASPHTVVTGEEPFRVGDLGTTPRVPVAGADLDDGRSTAAGGVVGPEEQLHFRRLGNFARQHPDAIRSLTLPTEVYGGGGGARPSCAIGGAMAEAARAAAKRPASVRSAV